MTNVIRGAGIPVVARCPVRLLRVGARSCSWIALPIVALIPGRAGDCRLPRASASHANVIARASASVVARRSVSLRGVRALTRSWVTRSSQMALVLRLANHPEALVHLAGIRTAIVVDRVSIVAFFAPTNAESDCMAGIGVPADGAQVGPVEVGGLIPQHLLLPRSRRTYAGCCPRQLARALDADRKRTILGPSQKLRVRYFDGSDSRLAVTGVGQRNARDFNVVEFENHLSDLFLPARTPEPPEPQEQKRAQDDAVSAVRRLAVGVAAVTVERIAVVTFFAGLYDTIAANMALARRRALPACRIACSLCQAVRVGHRRGDWSEYHRP